MTRDDWLQVIRDLPIAALCLVGLIALFALIVAVTPA